MLYQGKRIGIKPKIVKKYLFKQMIILSKKWKHLQNYDIILIASYWQEKKILSFLAIFRNPEKLFINILLFMKFRKEYVISHNHNNVQMKKHVIIFKTKNKQESYVESMQILDSIISTSEISCQNKCNPTCFLQTLSEQNLELQESKLAEVIANWAETNNYLDCDSKEISTEKTDYTIWFHVECDKDEDDIVNLQYFFLIKQWLIEKKQFNENEIYLYIKIDGNASDREINSLYFKASHFLLYTGGSSCFADYVENGIKKVTRLSSKSEISLTKFTPLNEIKMSDEIGIEYWQQSMGSFLNRCERINISWNDIIPTVILNANKKNSERKLDGFSQNNNELRNTIKRINQRIQQQKDEASKNIHYRLLWTLKNLFCTKSVSIARKRQELINNEPFKKKINTMSVLSFYLLCLFEYHSDSKMNYEEDLTSLDRITLRMRDLCDGFGQLMQNTIDHSDYCKGYFFIRIHDKNNIAYLKNKYKKYVDENPLNDKNLLYLEVQISDYSSLNVPDKFISNVQKRKKSSDNSDKKQYENLLNKHNGVSLSTFFYPSTDEAKFWEEYYQISDNIVYHYGLQMFDSVVRSTGGCFLAISSANYKLQDTKKCVYCSFSKDLETEYTDALHIPGTQYSVLFPLGYYEEVGYTAVNADIDYTNLLENQFESIPLELSMREIDQKIEEEKKNSSGQKSLEEIKKNIIVSVSDRLSYSIDKGKKDIVYYVILPVNDENIRNIEIFCKILIRFVTYYLKNNKAYIALLNCSDKFLIEMTRMLTVFYNKWGQSQLLKNLQIYLSGIKPEQSFLFGGQNIASILNRAEKMAIARGVQIGCIDIITNMLQRKSQIQSTDVNKLFSIVPFELLSYGNKPMLFKDIVGNILNSNICNMPTGCKIEDTHVRLGSKVHLNEFYQAELLFQNNYFTTRFAYLVAEDISNKMQGYNNIVLVGYETYSEMLIYEIKDLLSRKYHLEVNYIIYEQKGGERFRYYEKLKKRNTYNGIYIVPINSTLTTHNKMQASLTLFNDKNEIKFVTIGNYAILLLCPSGNKSSFKENEIQFEYGWEEIDDTQVTSNLVDGKKVRYFFRQDITWYDAIKCKYCFPDKKNYIQERPLIETNKASIIPMQKLELIENSNTQYPQTDNAENSQRVNDLSHFLVYYHLERNGNHFNYYFQMGKFFSDNRDKIASWLQKCEIIRQDENNYIIFDIIVAPQHYSNNGFVKEVNKCVFHNASLVLDVEVNKEFRSNVKAKYSSLLLLYNNLNKCNRKAKLCFHFVDDTIISGTTFYRAKSLIRSIFPEKLEGCVKVSVFESVFLMLNRSSPYSKLNYNLNNYFAYVDLKISSIRIQEDACVLCNIVKEAKKMEIISATTSMSKYWKLREEHHKCYNTKNAPAVAFSEKNRERGRRRMLCAHNANIVLNGKVTGRNNPNEVKDCIINNLLLNQSTDVKIRFEWMLSYLKVLSRPFFSFSVVIRKAIFEILLILLDFMLGNNKLKKTYPEMKNIFNVIDELNEQREFSLLYILLFTLIKRLADLGATFIIRKENIEKIITYYNKIKAGDTNQQFLLEYRACIKKLTSTSGDEIRGTWLEYLLINKCEYEDHSKKGSLKKDIDKFYCSIYMENISVFRDAITDLTKDQHIILKDKIEKQDTITLKDIEVSDSYKKVISNYYLKNFRKIYDWNFNENETQENNILDNICYLYNYLIFGTHINKDIVRYYTQLTKILAHVTTAERVQIILPNTNDGFYVIGDSLSEHPLELDTEFLNVLNHNCIFEDGTYFLDNEKIGILKFEGDNEEDVENCIYFCFLFSNKKRDKKQRYIRNVLILRSEITQQIKEDFATNAIQKFLISSKQNKILADSRAYDHSYAKTRQAFLEKAHNIACKWIKEGPQNNANNIKDVKDQLGFLYSIVANTVISRLFQKAVTGKFNGKEDWSAYTEIFFHNTVLAELELFNLYDKRENGENENFDQLQISFKEDNLDQYYFYESSNFTLSSIFLLLMINVLNHNKGNTDLKVIISIEKSEEDTKIIFKNLWEEKNPEDKVKTILDNINQPNYDRRQGITLWTLNQYFRYITRNAGKNESGISVFSSQKGNETYFNIGLPILVERD